LRGFSFTVWWKPRSENKTSRLSPNPYLLFLPTGSTSPWRRLSRPRPLSPVSRLATSLSVDGFLGGAAVKGGKNIGGASGAGGVIRSCTASGGKQRWTGLVPGSRGGPFIPALSPARRGHARRGLRAQLFFPSLSYDIWVSPSQQMWLRVEWTMETRGHGGEQGRRGRSSLTRSACGFGIDRLLLHR
jgi:hypothetical protein